VRVLADQFIKAAASGSTPRSQAGQRPRRINRTIAAIRRPRCSSTRATIRRVVERSAHRREAVAKEGNWRSFMPERSSRRRRAMARCTRAVNIHDRLAVLQQVCAGKSRRRRTTNWTDVFRARQVKAAGLIPLAFSGTKTWERNLFSAFCRAGRCALFEGIYGKRDAALAAVRVRE